MTILAIDTAGVAASVALMREEQALVSFYVHQSPSFTRPVLRIIDLVLNQAGYDLTDLTAMVVNIGPGAFTGLRVGLALAHGLALSSGKPVIGCSAFEALVALVPEWDGMICPVLEARKGEVYAAFYHQQDGVVQETAPGMVVTPKALCARVTERTLFVGNGVRVYKAALMETLGRRAVCRDTGADEVGLAVSLARVAGMRLRLGDSQTLPLPQPLYIRPADARLQRHRAQTSNIG